MFAIIITNITFPYFTFATTVPLSDISIGKVISMSGLNFVKIEKNKYMSVCGPMQCSGITHCTSCSLENNNKCSQCESGYIVSGGACIDDPTPTMQEWDDCDNLPDPECTNGNNDCKSTTIKAQLFTYGPILMDERDGKKYEIRKFPDGKCWMVDNLAYGGTTSDGATDYCSGKTTVTGHGNGKSELNPGWYGQIGDSQTVNTLFGDCLDPHVSGRAPCNADNPVTGVPQCGYYYNWQAAMQLATAYYGDGTVNVEYPSGAPSIDNHIRGICPAGWHLPSGGGTASEFVALDQAIGGNGKSDQTGNSFVKFWRVSSLYVVTSTDPWKTINSGASDFNGNVGIGNYAGWWSSTQYNPARASYIDLDYNNVDVQSYENYGKNNFDTVRCVKD
jgi:uncharacterized protein (TIGR02145 family)